MDKLSRIEKYLEQDEILSAYDHTARDLEPAFETVAQSLPEEERRLLLGYADSLKLARLRLQMLLEEIT